jgi:hypothetical protein
VGWLETIQPRRSADCHVFRTSGALISTPSSAVTTTGGLSQVFLNIGTAQKILRVRFTLSTGDFTTGTVRQYRRIAP